MPSSKPPPTKTEALEADPPNSLPIVRPAVGKRIPPIKTQARSAVILPNFVGLKFQVYNGKVYNDVTITEQMVGHKLGEFSPYDPPLHRCSLELPRVTVLTIN